MAKQKHGKSPGPDGIYNAWRLLLMEVNDRATIIPLAKCKTGGISDVNKYRAIGLSNSVTKIL